MLYIYPADCTDFSNNGLGAIYPSSAIVKETLNGEYELELKHPYDETGKWQRLVEGCIIRAPVPAAMTPQIDIQISEGGAVTDVYKVTTNRDPLRLRSGTGTNHSILAKYAKGTKVVLVEKTSADWYEVVCPDGKRGFMASRYLTYDHSDTTPGETRHEVVESRQLRDQPFRIYRVVPSLDEVAVYARHIFYDLLDNMVKKYEPSDTTSGSTAITGLSGACLSEHPFSFFSDLTSTASEVSYENKNPVDCLLGDEGLIEKYGGELQRDWFDIYVVERVGHESNLQIRQGKNLTGIKYDVDLSDVVTRIMPTGQDRDGNVLYLPEIYVDSENIERYPAPKWIHLAVSDAKEADKSRDDCYAAMRDAAQAEYDKGCDLPDVTLTVEFIDVTQAEEYKEYRFLQSIFLGDTVQVIAPRIGVSVAMRMTAYSYNCLTRQYEQMTLGSTEAQIGTSTITARQLPGGVITGSKLALNSVGRGQLQNGSVGAMQIGQAAIGNAHIKNAAIAAANIQTAAISYAHLMQACVDSLNTSSLQALTAHIDQIIAGTIDADQLYADLALIAAAQITTANIQNANINWAQIQTLSTTVAAIAKAHLVDADIDWANITRLQAAIADIFSTNIRTANIEWAHVVKLNSDQSIFSQGEAGELYITDLAVTEGNIVNLTVGSLLLKDSDGNFRRLLLDGDEITSEVVQVSNDNVQNLSINGSEKLIDGTITAGKLNAQNIFGDSALIRQLIAQNLDVDTLFARDATITALNAADITGNQYLRLFVREEETARNLIVNTLEPAVTPKEDRPRMKGQTIASTGYSGNVLSTAVHGVRITSSASSQHLRWYHGSGDEKTLNGLVPGRTYTYSFDYTCRLFSAFESTGTVYFRFYVYTSNTLDGSYAQTTRINIENYTAGTGTEPRTGRAECTFTVPDTAVKLYIFIGTSTTGGMGDGDFIEFRNMMLEEGDTAHAYRPADEDYASSTSLSTAITMLEDSISLKAEKTEVAALSDDVEAAQEAIGTLTNDVDSLGDSVHGLSGDVARALSSTEVIIGTQTAATNAWTGRASFSSLVNGQTILYWLPFAGTSTAATLNLTLSGGGTTGAKNVYIDGTTRCTTHITVGNMVQMVYRENASIGTGTYTGWWISRARNDNNYDRIRLNNVIRAKSAISSARFIVGDANGYFHLAPGVAFDVEKPILWATGTLAAGATGSSNYLSMPTCTLRNNCSAWSGRQYATVYIAGTLSGKTFTVASSDWLTTDPDDPALTYIALGWTYSTYQIYLYPEHPMYRLIDGELVSTTQMAYDATVAVEQLGETVVQHSADLTLLNDSITATVDRLTQTANSVEALRSTITQTAESITAELNRKADNDAISAWARYELQNGVGTLELGQEGSEYVTRTSNDGFRVLQDGQPMTSMVRGRVIAPVYEAGRQIELGEYTIRKDSAGGVFFI